MVTRFESRQAGHFHSSQQSTTGRGLSGSEVGAIKRSCGSGSVTGRYLIYTPRASCQDEKRFDANWHKFVAVCRSLDRDGLTYDVQFNLTGDNPHVVITACGTAKP